MEKQKSSVLLEYVFKNKKSFIAITVIFFIGIVIGIFLVNNATYTQKEEISEYVKKLEENIKETDKLNNIALISTSLKENIIFIILIWFLGCTIVGSIFIYLAICYKGIMIGYTISAIIASLNINSGFLFSILALLPQNIFLLPAIFLISESGIKLYNEICKHCVNLKIEVLRHFVVMLIAIILVVIASFIEVYVSTKLLIFFKDFL